MLTVAIYQADLQQTYNIIVTLSRPSEALIADVNPFYQGKVNTLIETQNNQGLRSHLAEGTALSDL
jgi:hypothetical protein